MPPLTEADIAHRVTYRKPVSDEAKKAHDTVRSTIAAAMHNVNDGCPDGREKALSLTKLEEAMFWANAAIARNQGSEGGQTD